MIKRSIDYLCIVLVLTLFSSFHVYAETLNWKASPGEVLGYKVYYGLNTNPMSQSIDVGNVTKFSIDQLILDENTQYFFSVSAYNSAGESVPCQAVAFTLKDSTPPLPPNGLGSY